MTQAACLVIILATDLTYWNHNLLICNLRIKGAGKIVRSNVDEGLASSKIQIKAAFGISFPLIILFL